MTDVFPSLDLLTDQSANLSKLEVATGYQASNFIYLIDERHVSRDLTQLSKDAAAISNTISIEWFRLNILKQCLELLTDYSSHPLATELALWKDVAGIAHLALQMVDNRARSDITTVKRIENQMTVIFNLIAREDTAATIRLAEAARRDSSSMKTLAVMTMAFLPATSLATVFAMPGLTRDEPPGFNVYLAVSIPTTVAILLGWAAITQRQVMRDLLRDVRRAKGSSKGKTVDSGVEMASMDQQP